MDLSNNSQAETIVGAETIELSLERLASVSGGVGTNTSTTVITGDCKVTYKSDSKVVVTCSSPPTVTEKPR